MKRREFIKRSAVTLAALGAASLTGCAGSGDSTTGGKLVKVAMCVADTTPAAQALKEVFIPQVEKETEGRYSIQLYPSNVLGGEKVVYDYTKTGIVEMCVVGTGMWSETPKMSSPDFPFMFRDVEHASRCYQGELGDYLKEEVESTQPLQLLCWMPNGVRAFSSNRKLTSMGDFKGQKLRMPNNPIHVRLAESLGANVVIMDMGEVFTALEQGVVDGQEGCFNNVVTLKFYEAQKYATQINYSVHSANIIASERWLQSLPEKERNALIRAGKEAMEYERTKVAGMLEADDKLMVEHGMELLGVVEDLPEWIRLGRTAWPKCYEVIGDGNAEKGKAVMDIVLAKKEALAKK